ncbi:ABC transporter substrate-binding protein [Rhodovibrio salinarum]|uniref:ABC transporter permease n=1 Tax=Rhodovibrio salinarum TaxID=1087 RepID=A0A934UZE4_9PROT|nr:ABC transporter substrate-binding protein [Rhodovibrio salinarum]MBK1696310.1 ABC transporter permease [Rhodovibrio salinarum]
MSIRRFALAMAALAAPLVLAGVPANAQEKSVAVTAIVEHPALDAVRDGVRDELEAQGYVPGENLAFTYETAQGNPAIASQIARQFAGENHDVIVPISTPSAQAVLSATDAVPVVFSAVTDPVAARLVGDPDNPKGRVTGVSDLSPVKRQLELIREVMPEAKTVGVLYNPGEANSVKILELLKQYGPEYDFNIVESVSPKSSGVLSATRNLVGKADAVYIPTDNTIISALESAIKVGMDNDLPIFAADTASVPRGAAMALGFDYYDLGRQTGRIVVRILEGEAPSEIPVESVQKTQLAVNPASAKRMGLEIPQAVMDRADEVVEE